MFAKRPPLLLAFAGGCLSGAAVILSGVGVVSIWRGGPAAFPNHQGADERGREVARAHVAAADAARERTLGAPTTDTSADTTEHERVAPHASDDAAAERPAEPGSSVADVLTRLEAAYRQGLVDGARASANHGTAVPGTESQTDTAETPSVTAPVAEGPHDAPAHEAPVATATANSPAVAATAPTPVAAAAPTIVAVPAQPVVVALAPPPATLAPGAYPTQALAAGAAPPAAPQDQAGSHDGYTSVTQNIHVDNLHQGDVYQQQLAVMQYMQFLSLSPYGAGYSGYVPPAAPTHRHYGTTTTTTTPASPFSTPPLPNAAPPYPPFLTSLTNPANPYGYQHRAGRAFR